MGTLHLDDDNEALGNLDAKVEQPRRVVVDDSAEATDDLLVQTWVRHTLGKNRGEDRPYHGTAASFDVLLDQRLRAAPPVPLTREY